MTRKNLAIIAGAGIVILGSLAYVILGGGPSRSERTDTILSTLSTEELIARRTQLDVSLERLRQDPDSKYLRMAEESRATYVAELKRRGVDPEQTLTPQEDAALRQAAQQATQSQ